jgi:hypothetical protein
MKEEVPLPEKISASFQQLAAAATELNAVSDELGKAIGTLDGVLQHLNLGVSTWVKVSAWTDDNNGFYTNRDLGYAKEGSKWGICLRIRQGVFGCEDEEQYESWLFNDAPRALRVDAIDKLPDLLEQLIKPIPRPRRFTQKSRRRNRWSLH